MNWDWRARMAEDQESEVDEEAVKSVEDRIHRLQSEIDEVWATTVWQRIDAMLADEFRKHSEVVFKTADFEELKLSRERARVIAQLRRLPEEADRQLQELARERHTLLGEDEAPEE